MKDEPTPEMIAMATISRSKAMQNDELLPVTAADRKRADDWATMLGRMGGVILDQSQRRGLAAQFAAHRIESTRTVPSGDDKHPEIGPGLPPLSSVEGRTAGEDSSAIDEIAALRAENARLREALVNEREENLWNAYNTGHVRDGKWDHLCMSDGEWLARECGFNVSDCRFDDEAIRAAIPKAARKALAHKDVNANIGGTDAC